MQVKLRKNRWLCLHPQGLEFKGQMLYCHESDCLLFLASPLVDGLEALTSRGLFISDIPIHDATRDIVLVGEQARAQVGSFFFFLHFCYPVLFISRRIHFVCPRFFPPISNGKQCETKSNLTVCRSFSPSGFQTFGVD
jgi:hypothetical protein